MSEVAQNPSMPKVAGTLYVVGTPIGNIDDLSARAAEVLGSVDLIAAEDTRRTGRLLSRIRVKAQIIACHEHNEREKAAELVEALEAGRDVALVSDAGMPLISDPGWRLVRQARASGCNVVSVPGPSAVTAALSVSGLPTDRFVFEGFLPRRPGPRAGRLAMLADEQRTLVFFEAVHRLGETLAAMAEAFGATRDAVLARELTKLHESVRAGSLATLAGALGTEIPLRGEFVIVVAGAEEVEAASDAEVRRIFEVLARELAPGRAAALCSEITGVPRNRVYALTRGGD